jgi:drug/metabolite transporter (DMT)-like permease
MMCIRSDPFFLISWGEQMIDSAVASVLDATVPVFTLLIAHDLLDDDKITLPKMMGLLIGFAGVVVLLSKDISNASTSSLLGQAPS